jgi:hypothetical protein
LAKLASISSEWDDVPRAEDSSGFELKFKNAKNSPDASVMVSVNQKGCREQPDLHYSAGRPKLPASAFKGVIGMQHRLHCYVFSAL